MHLSTLQSRRQHTNLFYHFQFFQLLYRGAVNSGIPNRIPTFHHTHVDCNTNMGIRLNPVPFENNYVSKQLRFKIKIAAVQKQLILTNRRQQLKKENILTVLLPIVPINRSLDCLLTVKINYSFTLLDLNRSYRIVKRKKNRTERR